MSVLDDVRLHLVETLDDVHAFTRWLGERRPILALDIETSGLSLAKDRIRLVQFGDGAHGWAIPYEEWRGVIRQTLAEYRGPVALQHAKFDAGFLLRDGLPFRWEQVHDTMFMSALVDSQGPKSLKPAAALYVDPIARAGQDELKKAMAVNRWGWGDIPVTLPAYWGYSAADTVLTALLAETLWPRVQPFREAYDLELACERVLCEMEGRGLRIDVDYTRAAAGQLDAKIADLHAWLAGQGVANPGSSAQVVAALEAAGITFRKRTATGKAKLDEDVLRSIDNPIAAAVLEIRGKVKLLSTYFEAFLEERDDDLLHPHINQLAARTHRMSVTEPPLQTLPRDSFVRDAFIPREGRKLVLADYDTQELRILAHLSGDEQMIADFLSGVDLHMETARGAYGPNAGKPERTVCKNANYARQYGAQPPKIAETAGVSVPTVQAVFDAFDRRYPQTARFREAIVRAVTERAGEGDYGWVTLDDTRRLRVPKARAFTTAASYRIQGQGGSVLKRALVNLDAAGLGDYLNLPVHDEVVFDIPEPDVDDALPAIRAAMERHEYRAPLTVGTKVVDRWGDAYREEAA